MDKMKMRSPDLSQKNIAKIRELFPNTVTETRNEATGELRLAVDFDQLRQEMSDYIVEGPQERYRLDWPGKRAALTLSNAPIAKTLRPCVEESIDFNTTQNLFIEGDNLEGLKLLQESYLGQIKVIYIDPPYNTGNDFIYDDNFSGSIQEYLEKSGQKGSGNKLIANNESNGRFHSDWLSFLYPRLRVARTLLRKDGIIVISISDEEEHNLRHICNEIFGTDNHIGTVVWNSTKSVINTALISVGHTYNLIYAQNKDYFIKNRSHFRLPEDGDGFSNPDNDLRGPWKADPFQVGGWRPNQQYTIQNPNTGEEYHPNPDASWKNDQDTFKELLSDGRIVFGTAGTAGPQRKRFLKEAKDRGKVAKTWWDDVGTTSNGTAHLKKLFDGLSIFSNPKPVNLIERLIQLTDHTNEGIILDFFGGSGTTAEAVLKGNSLGANRKYILIQLPENIDSTSRGNEAIISFLEKNQLAANIASISKERIKRSSIEISKQNGIKDTGFRVLKVDTSNMKQVYYYPDKLGQTDLLDTIDNVKDDRTPEDLLFQVLVDWGVDLTLPIRSQRIQSKKVFFVNENALIACFEKGLTEGLIKKLAGYEPLRVVFRDNGFASDSIKINVGQIIKQISPKTEVKAI